MPTTRKLTNAHDYLMSCSKVLTILFLASQKKFRAIVKAAGFDLVNGQITGADGSRGASLDVLTPPPKRGRAKKADGEASKKSPLRKETTESSAKKRKLAQSPKHADEAGEGKTVRQDVDDEAEPPGQNGQTGAGEG